MKKFNSILCILLLTVVVTLTGMFSVSATPDTTVISKEGVMVSYIGTNYKWAAYHTSENTVAYCMDGNLTWPEVATTMSNIGKADAGVKYILENGYPYRSYTNGQSPDKDRFITQAAVWWYLADTGQGPALSADFTETGYDDDNLRPIIKNLVNQAKSASDSSTDGSLDVTVSDGNMTLSEDKKYYVSNEISSTVVGGNSYTVSVSGADGVIITSTSGEEKTTFSSNEKFLVKIPANSLNSTVTLNVKVSANVSNGNKAVIFKSSNANIQRVVSLYEEKVNLEKSISLTATVKSDNVCVTYVIVGDVIPDPALTDPTPGKSCYEKGTKYTQEHTLTTRQKSCTFKGWYTKENLTGRWTNGTALNKDLTLYGAWDCEEGTTIIVPPTSANTPIMVLGFGALMILIGGGMCVYRFKSIESNK
ncbi:MAG: Cys-Gln thioester bond-forming surface protein [Bacilli bacterium]|nr:Cys-Gln thioester bond-forming surface protein [Bacilli bacterium]